MFAHLVVGVGLLAATPSDEPPRGDVAGYEAARRNVGREAGVQVRLALWCEAHGLPAERLRHLALAVVRDPKNASARGLMGLVAFGGQWNRPDAVAEKVKADAKLTALLAEYNARRARLRETADAHWALALWCDQNGLDAEAKAHFSVVTRLDPSRAGAWKRLGCKKVGGRWVTEADLAAEKKEADAQKKGDKHWKPVLTKWRGLLGDKTQRTAAEDALAGVTDPYAVSAVWSVFVAPSATTHARAVQLLGQIDAPAASRALVFLAVFDDSPEVRRRATETLKRRDPREFAGLLVNLLRKPVRYDLRPVGGPGSPGALFVEGKQFNVQRIYSPPALPVVPMSPNDQVIYDSNGLPVISRVFLRSNANPSWPSERVLGVMSLSQFAQFNPIDPALASAVADYRSNPQAEWQTFFQTHPGNNEARQLYPRWEAHHLGVQISASTNSTTTTLQQTQIPVGQLALEYQKAALSAQAQLARDVALIDGHNDAVKRLNERVAGVLGDISGQQIPSTDLEAWRAWWVNLKGYAYIPPPESPRPTVVENVPLAYAPQGVPVISSTQTETQVTGTSIKVQPYSSMPSCFGAGTLVRTLAGSCAIESIRVGDRVLTLDVKTGALGYQPVTVIHHNPPSLTFLVKLRGDTIVSSPFHRFWIAGKGWIMARDLRGGELLRLLDGPAQVESVKRGPMQPVFNLDVAGDHDFFAGAAAALVHDNTLPEMRLEPFDAAPELVANVAEHVR